MRGLVLLSLAALLACSDDAADAQTTASSSGQASSGTGGAASATGGIAVGGSAGASPDAGPRGPAIDASPAELVFSGVKGTTSASRSFVVKNVGGEALSIAAATLAGQDAASFTIDRAGLPPTIGPGEQGVLAVTFTPDASAVGSLSASITIESDADRGALKLGLYGLSAEGEYGNAEPTFAQVVETLGFAIDVGGDTLTLGTGAAPIGDEVLVPLFQKAGAGPVGLVAVARYSPDETVPFGYYTPSGGTPMLHATAALSTGQDQTLNPTIDAGGALTFEPVSEPFGVYTEGLYGGTEIGHTFTEDALNAGGISHRARSYPLKDREGNPVPNAWLIGFEPATNGDYQDYVFVLSNVAPAP